MIVNVLEKWLEKEDQDILFTTEELLTTSKLFQQGISCVRDKERPFGRCKVGYTTYWIFELNQRGFSKLQQLHEYQATKPHYGSLGKGGRDEDEEGCVRTNSA